MDDNHRIHIILKDAHLTPESEQDEIDNAFLEAALAAERELAKLAAEWEPISHDLAWTGSSIAVSFLLRRKSPQ